MSYGEKWSHILPIAGRSEATNRNGLVGAHNRDGRPRYHRSAWVGDTAGNRGCDFLAGGVTTEKEQQNTRQCDSYLRWISLIVHL